MLLCYDALRQRDSPCRRSACRCCVCAAQQTTPQVFTSGRLDVYILVPMLWALYNAIPPLLFFVYFFTKGRVLQGMCSFMQGLGVVLAAGEGGMTQGSGFKLCGLWRGLGCCGGGRGGGQPMGRRDVPSGDAPGSLATTCSTLPAPPPRTAAWIRPAAPVWISTADRQQLCPHASRCAYMTAALPT